MYVRKSVPTLGLPTDGNSTKKGTTLRFNRSRFIKDIIMTFLENVLYLSAIICKSIDSNKEEEPS